MHLSLSKLLSIFNSTQCSNEVFNKVACVEIVILLGGSLIKPALKKNDKQRDTMFMALLVVPLWLH